MKKNNDIRELAKKHGVYLYEIAMELNVSELLSLKV